MASVLSIFTFSLTCEFSSSCSSSTSLNAFSSAFASAYCFSSWSRFNSVSFSKNSISILTLATLADASALASYKEYCEDLHDMSLFRDFVFDVWPDVTLFSEP